MTKTLFALVLVFAFASPAFAQRYYVFPNLVQIRGTANVTLDVLGGARITNVVEIKSGGDGTGNNGLRITRNDGSYLIVNMDDGGSSAFGSIQAGDSGTYRPLKLNPLGSRVEALIYTSGDGSASAPAITFTADTTTGLYRTTNVLNFAVNGAQAGTMQATANSNEIRAPGGAFGTGALRTGGLITAARNTSGAGAPGLFRVIDKSGNNQYL